MEQEITKLQEAVRSLQERLSRLERTSGPQVIEEIIAERNGSGQKVAELEKRVKELEEGE
jgi:uncharacterized coiled-coil protein SlyX